ncbi:MAG: ABC transporter permease [Acidobacteria bacterium]|nr:MAG: ABC transporter permease [Acidobacteriota bacterium]
MSLRSVAAVAGLQSGEALRNRWFLLYAVAFALLAVGLSALSALGAGQVGLTGFGRTTASLINLSLLVVPLMGLTAGATALAAERERGTLELLAALPLTRGEILAGKFAGLSIALGAALAAALGITGLAIAAGGGLEDLGAYLVFALSTVLLGLAMLAVGLLVSALAPRASLALGVALSLWFLFAFLSDLGLIGSSLVLRLGPEALFRAVLVNPLQAYKLAVLAAIGSSLDVLGPAGHYAMRTFGDTLLPLLGGVLLVWTVLPLLLAGVVLHRRDHP